MCGSARSGRLAPLWGLALLLGAAAAGAEPLPSWNDGPGLRVPITLLLPR